MYRYIRPLLFKLDPEVAHSLTIQLLRLVAAIPGIRQAAKALFCGPRKPVEAFSLVFPNCIGLAAGYDKDGCGWRGLSLLGFGHIELGTVTPRPQSGNPRPRVFRLIEERAMINRMGFPGSGADHLAGRMAHKPTSDLILGVNLGKNMDTPLEDAISDYLDLLRVFAPLADYLVINVSSPNTVGLRQLQAFNALSPLLSQLDRERRLEEARLSRRVPILVKLAPDLTEKELDQALQVILETRMDGVVATNTTIDRTGLRSHSADERGGLSGAPLKQKSTQMIRGIYKFTDGKLPIIGSGGVMSASDAREKLDAGAILVQVYTGLVYSGPGLVKEILAKVP